MLKSKAFVKKTRKVCGTTPHGLDVPMGCMRAARVGRLRGHDNDRTLHTWRRSFGSRLRDEGSLIPNSNAGWGCQGRARALPAR